MRSQFSTRPQFLFNDTYDHPVARKFYEKYNQIDSILENNNEILKEVHRELEITMNAMKGRSTKFSTETLFRMLLVKCMLVRKEQSQS